MSALTKIITVDVLREEYRSMSIAQIAAKYGVKREDVRYALRWHGIKNEKPKSVCNTINSHQKTGKKQPNKKRPRPHTRRAPVGGWQSPHHVRVINSARQQGISVCEWKSFKTNIYKLARKSKEFSAWRTSVFIRDNFTCQECGERGGKLHPHHVIPFRDAREKLCDVTNGITLCESCHRKTVGKEYLFVAQYAKRIAEQNVSYEVTV